MAVMPVRQFTFGFRIPLVLFVVLVGAKGHLKLFVLVGDVSHNSEFRLFGSVVHNCMQIVKVVLTVVCLLGSIRCLFFEFGLFDCPLCRYFDVRHRKRCLIYDLPLERDVTVVGRSEVDYVSSMTELCPEGIVPVKVDRVDRSV